MKLASLDNKAYCVFRLALDWGNKGEDLVDSEITQKLVGNLDCKDGKNERGERRSLACRLYRSPLS